MNLSVGFIFDMDGVIVDSNPYHKIALKKFCHSHGFELSEQQLLEKIYGRMNRDWIINLFGELSGETIEEYAAEKEALYREIYTNDIKPIDGLVAFLETLVQENYSRAVATSAPLENVEFTLSKTFTSHFFPIILNDSNVIRGKPDPEIYLKTAAALNIPPDQCVVFEDSLSGVSAGKAAGCKVVGITTTHSASELSGVDLVIDNFLNLDPKNVIRSLF